MTQSTITLNRDHLRAIACFAGIRDIRYYLNGVCMQVQASGARMFATDGRMLGMLPIANDDGAEPAPEPCSIIIPNDALKPFLKAGSSRALNILLLTYGGDGPCKLAEPGGVAVEFTPIDGTFPDCDRVIPTEYSGERAHFNFDLLAVFAKAASILRSKMSPSIMPNGNSAALVHISNTPDFVGVLMPMRDSDPKLPQWYADSRNPPEPVAELQAA